MPRTSEPLSSSAHWGQWQKAKGETEVGCLVGQRLSTHSQHLLHSSLDVFLSKILKYNVQMFLPILVLDLLKTCIVGSIHSHSTEVETEAVSHNLEEKRPDTVPPAPNAALSAYTLLHLSARAGPQGLTNSFLSFIPGSIKERRGQSKRTPTARLLCSPSTISSQNLRSTLAEGRPPGTPCFELLPVGKPAP